MTANVAATSSVGDPGRVLVMEATVQDVFDAVPIGLCVVNGQRQITFANRVLLGAADADESGVVGRPMGGVLNCIHSDVTAGGCGTTEACDTCGGNAAVRAALCGGASTRDFRVSLKDGDSLDMRVTATPLRGGQEPEALVAVLDVSNEKRRNAMERIFFHDVLNTAGGVRGLVDVIQEAPREEFDELLHLLDGTSVRLVDEIQSQRLLTAAENRELTVRPGPIQIVSFLKEIAGSYRSHEVAAGRHLVVDPHSDDEEISSDPTILARVLENLVKNALEACEEDMTVTVGCRVDPGSANLWVHNLTFIPRVVQLQIFQRSFSTKGEDRGLGTYSVRLLARRCLKAEVSFTSHEREGTTFTVRCPRLGGIAPD